MYSISIFKSYTFMLNFEGTNKRDLNFACTKKKTDSFFGILSPKVLLSLSNQNSQLRSVKKVWNTSWLVLEEISEAEMEVSFPKVFQIKRMFGETTSGGSRCTLLLGKIILQSERDEKGEPKVERQRQQQACLFSTLFTSVKTA